MPPRCENWPGLSVISGVRVPCAHEKGGQLRKLTPSAYGQRHGVRFNKISRRQQLHQRVRRHQCDFIPARAHPVERRDALKFLRAGYAFIIVEYIFPGRKEQDVVRRVEHGEQVAQPLRFAHIGHDENAAFAERVA